MTLETASAQLVAAARAAALPALHTLTPVQARRATVRDTPPGPPMWSSREERLHVREGVEIELRVLIPSESVAGTIVYFHGGGWMLGSAKLSDSLGRRLAAATDHAVVLVDYRKAPEHPFPAAIEDAWAALRWTAESAPAWAGHRSKLVVAGDSSGGNLAAVTAIQARDRRGPPIAAQILVYPVTDFAPNTSSYLDPDNQLMLDRPTMLWFWDHYVADESRRHNPLVSPLRAARFSGLPAAIVVTAEHDVLRDEGEAYAAALRASGVPVIAERFAGQMHAFLTLIGLSPGHELGLAFIARSLAELSFP